MECPWAADQGRSIKYQEAMVLWDVNIVGVFQP
jgi:hypothetical protein